MEPRAQTNAQLFLELHAAGVSGDELRRVRDAYLFAMQLYSGLFTGSGKTTLAHEVGVASLTHRYGGTIDLVVAGMLHGAYTVGDWGHWRVRATERKRAELRSVIGERAEIYVYQYPLQAWDAHSIASLARRARELTPLERDVSFMHLVDELDRLLEYGAVMFFRRAGALQEWFRNRRDDLCRLADGLQHPGLSAALAEAIDLTLAAQLPPELMGLTFPGDATFRVTPRSYRRRLSLRVYQALAGEARRVERALRSWAKLPAVSAERAEVVRRP